MENFWTGPGSVIPSLSRDQFSLPFSPSVILSYCRLQNLPTAGPKDQPPEDNRNLPRSKPIKKARHPELVEGPAPPKSSHSLSEAKPSPSAKPQSARKVIFLFSCFHVFLLKNSIHSQLNRNHPTRPRPRPRLRRCGNRPREPFRCRRPEDRVSRAGGAHGYPPCACR